MAIRSYKYRLKPTKAQAASLNEMLRDFCSLYNAGLQQRIEAYRRQHKFISFFDQAVEVKLCRADDPDGIGRWPADALVKVLRRLDRAYAGFFRRKKGYPRFRAAPRFHSADFCVGKGLTITKEQRIRVLGVPGGIKTIWHRDLPQGEKLSAAIISRQQGNWYVIFSVKADFSTPCGVGNVGVDLGVKSLVATSDGEIVSMPRFERKAHKAQRRRQRALARCQPASNRRLKVKARLASGSAKIARQRRDHTHKLSRTLVSRYQAIAFEKLNISGLTKGRVARSIHDAAWSMLVQFVQYKAESAGADVVMVDPRGTSQTCPHCGIIKAKPLKERRHRCECGSDLDRDVAAAMVVHQRAFGPGHGPRTPSQRDAA